MTEFIPQTFEKYFFSVTHSLVHSCLIQYKWSPERLNSYQYVSEWMEKDDDERMMGVYIECKDFKKALKELESHYKHPNENIKQFLFADEFGIIESRLKKSQF